jgi:hypothetical protein
VALLNDDDWKPAEWITPSSGNLLRVEFDVGSGLEHATLYWVALGQWL